MNRSLYLLLIILLLALGAYGQKLAKPTQQPVPLTPAQQEKLKEGIALHDAKRYDDAIAKYQAILAENADSTAAMYEMAMSLYTKGDKEKAIEVANRGSKYISDELPLFYVTMANVLDDYGKPQEAANIYQEGLKLLAGDNRFSTYRASLYYNLGVTQIKQKKYNEARSALKSAVENDYRYASPHYMLSVLYNGTKYRIPALLAASRFVAVEFNTERSGRAAATIIDVMKPAQKDPKTGNMTINLDFSAPKDEGDFGAIEIIAPTLLTPLNDKDKAKTQNQLFADGIDTVIAILGEDKNLASTFVGKNYIPFMVEMKEKGYVEPFAYMVLYLSGKQDAMDWLKAHDAELGSFLQWAKAYQLPAK